MRQRILEEWNEFKRALPPHMPPLQTTHMRRAFYCGAYAMFSVTHQIAAESADDKTAALALEEVHKEFDAFTARVGTDGY